MMFASNRLLSLRAAAASADLLGLAAAAPAHAVTNFANYYQASAVMGFTWKNDVIPEKKTVIPAVTKVVNGKVVVVTPAKTIITPAHDGTSATFFSTTASNPSAYGLADVKFNFHDPLLAALGSLDATFSFLGKTPVNDPALTVGNLLIESGLSGDFAFTYTGVKPLKVGHTTYFTGANLLSGSISNFDMTLSKGGTSGSAFGSTPNSTIVYTSDFLDFTNAPNRDLSIALVAAKPKFYADPGAAARTFSADSHGLFSADGVRVTAAIPEPSTWALMLLGFFGAGTLIRNRRQASATA